MVCQASAFAREKGNDQMEDGTHGIMVVGMGDGPSVVGMRLRKDGQANDLSVRGVHR